MSSLVELCVEVSSFRIKDAVGEEISLPFYFSFDKQRLM